jgi:hypothetical protein
MICIYGVSDSQESSVGTATGYRLEDQIIGVKFLAGAGNFFDTMYRVTLEPTHPPIQWILGDLSLGIKWLRHEADHSPPPSAKVKEHMGNIDAVPNTSSWYGA